MYPIIQLAMTATLNQFGSGVANNQFLFDDMVLVLVLAILMLRSDAVYKMEKFRPTDDLFSPVIVFSILGQLIICIGLFVFTIYSMNAEPWFCSTMKARSGLNLTTWLPLDPNAPWEVSYPCYYVDPEEDTVNTTLLSTYENTVLWLFGHFQFAILAVCFSLSSPHRQSPLFNTSFVVYLIATFALLIALLLVEPWQGSDLSNPQKWWNFLLSYVFSIREGVPLHFRLKCLALVAVNLIASVLWEYFAVNKSVRSVVDGVDIPLGASNVALEGVSPSIWTFFTGSPASSKNDSIRDSRTMSDEVINGQLLSSSRLSSPDEATPLLPPS